MGVCESCMKAEEEERQPLLGPDHDKQTEQIEAEQNTKEDDKKNFFETLIDDANRRFISSEYRHTQRSNLTAEEMR